VHLCIVRKKTCNKVLYEGGWGGGKGGRGDENLFLQRRQKGVVSSMKSSLTYRRSVFLILVGSRVTWRRLKEVLLGLGEKALEIVFVTLQGRGGDGGGSLSKLRVGTRMIPSSIFQRGVDFAFRLTGKGGAVITLKSCKTQKKFAIIWLSDNTLLPRA